MQYERQFGGDLPAASDPIGNGDLNATYCTTLADEFARLGVSHAVISPGSRSTPMSLALLRNAAISVQVCIDERSAAFVALGIGRATQKPALVVTTSGTATAELHPAVVEADLAGIPLIVCTADRPPELQRVWAPQTIDQTALFGKCLRLFSDPGPPTQGSQQYWRQYAHQCLASATEGVPGPVQLNLAFREPLLGTVGELPPVESQPPVVQTTFGILDEALAKMLPALSKKRGIIVAGERSGRSLEDAAAVLDLAHKLNWPVLADHLSGLRGSGLRANNGAEEPIVVDTYDLILRSESAASALVPEAIIRIGGLLSSKVTNAFLATSGAFQIGIDQFGICPDPDGVLASSYRAHIPEALAAIGSLGDPTDVVWIQSWQRAAQIARRVVDGEFESGTGGEPGLIAAACQAFDDSLSDAMSGRQQLGAVVVSSSMPVRDLEWFTPGFGSLDVHSNRGANGIDGVVSTAIGVACAGMPTMCVVGDVAMLHDSNSLIGLTDRLVDLYIVVIDNDGGGIFSFLPQGAALDPSEFETLFGTPHGTDFVALGKAHGVEVAELDDSLLASDIASWVANGGVRVALLKSDRHDNVEVHQRIYRLVQGRLADF